MIFPFNEGLGLNEGPFRFAHSARARLAGCKAGIWATAPDEKEEEEGLERRREEEEEPRETVCHVCGFRDFGGSLRGDGGADVGGRGIGEDAGNFALVGVPGWD